MKNYRAKYPDRLTESSGRREFLHETFADMSLGASAFYQHENSSLFKYPVQHAVERRDKGYHKGIDWTLVDALLRASRDGDVEAVEDLLQMEVALDAEGMQGHTSLHYAVGAGHRDVVDLLVNANARLDLQDARGSSILHTALLNDQHAIARYLVEQKAAVNIVDDGGWTVLHWAVLRSPDEFVQLLIASDAPLDVQNSRGLTPLHYAVQHDRPLIVYHLQKAKAKLDAANEYGETPVHFAKNKGTTLENMIFEGRTLDTQIELDDAGGPEGA